MSPKDKARELAEKMFNVDLDCENEAMCMLYPHAVRCALIAVDEVLKTNTLDSRNCGFIKLCEKHEEYWQEVKNEIEKL
jgi:hypothetical protein